MALDELFEKVNEEKISRRGVIKIGIAVGAGLAGATIAGCTSPTPTPSGTITPLPTVTPTPGPVLKNSGVGYLPSDHHAPLFVAAYKGADGKAQSIFEKHGLTVTTQLMTAGPTIMSQLSANKIDIALAGVAPTITQIDGDATIKIIAGVQSNGSGIIVGKDTGIAKVEDLRGRRVAIPGKGSIQDIMLRELCKTNNIDYNNELTVSVVPVGNQIGALVAGTIDAAITWEPFVSTALVNNMAKVLMRSEQIWPNHPCCCVSTTTDMISKNADTLKAFLASMKEANDFIKSSPSDAINIVAAAISGDSVAIETVAMPNVAFIVKPDETFIAGTETFAANMKTLVPNMKMLHTRADLFDLTLVNQVL